MTTRKPKTEDDRTAELHWVPQINLGNVTVSRNLTSGVVVVLVGKPPANPGDPMTEATRTVMEDPTARDLFAALGMALQTKAPA